MQRIVFGGTISRDTYSNKIQPLMYGELGDHSSIGNSELSILLQNLKVDFDWTNGRYKSWFRDGAHMRTCPVDEGGNILLTLENVIENRKDVDALLKSYEVPKLKPLKIVDEWKIGEFYDFEDICHIGMWRGGDKLPLLEVKWYGSIILFVRDLKTTKYKCVHIETGR